MWYLLAVVLLSCAGITLVLVRHRPRSSMDDSIREFERGLHALAPRDGLRRGARARVEE